MNTGDLIKGFQLNTLMYVNQVFVCKRYVRIIGYAIDCMKKGISFTPTAVPESRLTKVTVKPKHL